MGGPIPRKGAHTVSASGYVPWGSKSASGYGPRGVKIRCDTGLNQIEALKSGGFSWSEIARTLGISDKTLHRRRHKLGMRVEGREYSNLSDHDPFSSPEPFSLGHSLKIRLWFTRPNGKI